MNLTQNQRRCLILLWVLDSVPENRILPIFRLGAEVQEHESKFWEDIEYLIQQGYILKNQGVFEFNNKYSDKLVLGEADNRIIQSNPHVVMEFASRAFHSQKYDEAKDWYNKAANLWYQQENGGLISITAFFSEASCYTELQRYVKADSLYNDVKNSFERYFRDTNDIMYAQYLDAHSLNCLYLGLKGKAIRLKQIAINFLGKVDVGEAKELRTTYIEELKSYESQNFSIFSTFIRKHLWGNAQLNGNFILLILSILSVALAYTKEFSFQVLFDSFFHIFAGFGILYIFYIFIIIFILFMTNIVPKPQERGDGLQDLKKVHNVSRRDALVRFFFDFKKVTVYKYLIILSITGLLSWLI